MRAERDNLTRKTPLNAVLICMMRALVITGLRQVVIGSSDSIDSTDRESCCFSLCCRQWSGMAGMCLVLILVLESLAKPNADLEAGNVAIPGLDIDIGILL